MESSDEESGMYKSMEEESRSEVDDNDDISSDSNHADSVEIGDITNISLMWRMIRWMGSMLKTVLTMSLTKIPLTSSLRVPIIWTMRMKILKMRLILTTILNEIS